MTKTKLEWMKSFNYILSTTIFDNREKKQWGPLVQWWKGSQADASVLDIPKISKTIRNYLVVKAFQNIHQQKQGNSPVTYQSSPVVSRRDLMVGQSRSLATPGWKYCFDVETNWSMMPKAMKSCSVFQALDAVKCKMNPAIMYQRNRQRVHRIVPRTSK